MKKGKTIKAVVKDGLCTGCGTCTGICPTNAIEMVIDHRNGIYVPQLDEERCNDCGICYEVCPGHSVDFRDLNQKIFGKEPEDILIGNYLNCYVGHSTNYDIRYNSASGGLVTALLTFALGKGMIDGALVTRMKRDNPFEPEPFIARTKEEIISAAKSKYCPVPANIALREILEREGKYAVVGLPCHTQALRKAERINTRLKERIVLHFGLVCNHAPSFLATDYLLQKLGVSKERVSKIDYRGKGWPGQMSITLGDGSTKLVPHFAELYWGVVYQDFFYPSRCAICRDKICELSDISFMDAWLPELSQEKVGESIIVVRRRAGQELLQSALTAKAVELEKIPKDKVMQSQSLALVRKRYNARFSLFKRFGKEVPNYNQPLSKVRLADYLGAVSLYSRTYISGRRRLWFLVDWYLTLWRLARFSKWKLRAIKRYLVRLLHLERVH